MGYGPLWRKIAFRGYFSFHFLKEYIIKFKFQFFSSNVPSRGEEFKIEFDYVPSRGFPSGSEGKEFSCNAGDMGLIPGSGRSPGKENGYPLQYSCLGNSMDRGASGSRVLSVTKSQTQDTT